MCVRQPQSVYLPSNRLNRPRRTPTTARSARIPTQHEHTQVAKRRKRKQLETAKNNNKVKQRNKRSTEECMLKFRPLSRVPHTPRKDQKKIMWSADKWKIKNENRTNARLGNGLGQRVKITRSRINRRKFQRERETKKSTARSTWKRALIKTMPENRINKKKPNHFLLFFNTLLLCIYILFSVASPLIVFYIFHS